MHRSTKHYHKNEENKKKQIVWVAERRKKITKRIFDYKLERNCSACGENNPVCLDFHHRNPLEKITSISLIPRKGWGWKKTMKEINKCDLLCRNCHAKIHASMD